MESSVRLDLAAQHLALEVPIVVVLALQPFKGPVMQGTIAHQGPLAQTHKRTVQEAFAPRAITAQRAQRPLNPVWLVTIATLQEILTRQIASVVHQVPTVSVQGLNYPRGFVMQDTIAQQASQRPARQLTSVLQDTIAHWAAPLNWHVHQGLIKMSLHRTHVKHVPRAPSVTELFRMTHTVLTEYKTLKYASQDTIVQRVPNMIQSSHVLLAPTTQELAFKKKTTVPIALVENTVKLQGCQRQLATARQAITVPRGRY